MKTVYRLVAVLVAAVSFHLGSVMAVGSPVIVSDIVFSRVDGASRLSVITDEDVDFKVSFDRDKNVFTLRLLGANTGDIFSGFEHSDELIKSVTVTPDEEANVTAVDITFSKPGVSFYRTPADAGHGIVFDFYQSGKVIRLAGVAPEKLLTRSGERAAPSAAPGPAPEAVKEDLEKRFAPIDEQYGQIEANAGREKFIEIMKAAQKLEFEKAVSLSGYFISAYPRSMYLERVYFAKADALFHMSKRDPAHIKAAIEAYQTASAQFPSSRLIEKAMMRRASLYEEQEFYIEALSEYGGLLNLAPKSKYAVAAMLGRASIFMGQQKYQKAYNELERILILYPTRREVRDVKYMIATSYYDRGMYKEADTIFEESLKLWPTYPKLHPSVYIIIAETRYKLGYLQKAMEDWAAIVNLFPESFEGRRALLRIGDIYAEINQKKKAVKIYENAIRRFPDKDEAVMARLALASLGAEDPEILRQSAVFDYSALQDPLKTFDEIISKYPEKYGENALMRKGKALTARKRYVSAILAYKELLRGYPKARMSEEVFALVRENLLNLIKTFHDQEGFFTVLLTYYDNFDPFLRSMEEPDILFSIADSYRAMTLYDRAQEYYSRVAVFDDKKRFAPRTAFYMARTALDKGTEPEKAERLFGEYLARFPADANVQRARGLLGDSFMAQGRLAEAATEWRLCVEMNPESQVASQVAYKLGGLYKGDGKYQLAIDAFYRAVGSFKPDIKSAEDPEYIKDSYYKIAESYYLDQNYPAAIREADSFMRRYPEDARASWMEYIVSSSFGRIDREDKALASLKGLADRDRDSVIGKVAATRLATLQWKRNNPDLFLD